MDTMILPLGNLGNFGSITSQRYYECLEVCPYIKYYCFENDGNVIMEVRQL
jgi:hypothetical protein